MQPGRARPELVGGGRASHGRGEAADLSDPSKRLLAASAWHERIPLASDAADDATLLDTADDLRSQVEREMPVAG